MTPRFAGLCAGFPHQALAAPRIARGGFGQHLDRDRAIEREVGREVDLAHAAGADAALDAKVPELHAGREARSTRDDLCARLHRGRLRLRCWRGERVLEPGLHAR